MKYALTLIAFLLFVYMPTVYAQSTLDKLIFEDAQHAYAKRNYRDCLKKVEELEKKGVKGPVILHLKIMATSKTWPGMLTDEQLAQFKKDVDHYLKHYDNEDFLKQYRDVYEVKKRLSSPEYTGGMAMQEFHRMLKQNRFVFVVFTAKWSAPGVVFKKQLQTIEPELNANGVTVIKPDVDSNRTLLKSLEIKYWPAYFLYDDGKLLWSGHGIANIEVIKETILQRTKTEN